MRHAAIAALGIAAVANAETMFTLSDSMVVWNGGFAADIGNGWIGSGWDRFPGYSPPWNPIGQPQFCLAPPQAVPMPAPQPPAVPPQVVVVVQAPPPPPPPLPVLTFHIAGQVLHVQRTW